MLRDIDSGFVFKFFLEFVVSIWEFAGRFLESGEYVYSLQNLRGSWPKIDGKIYPGPVWQEPCGVFGRVLKFRIDEEVIPGRRCANDQ